MTTVAILPVTTSQGQVSYQAVSGCRIAVGTTAGAALDALTAEFPEVNTDSFVVIQRFRADDFFSSEQKQRLQALMSRWREARDTGGDWSRAEQAELEALVDVELAASARRAEETARGLGR